MIHNTHVLNSLTYNDAHTHALEIDLDMMTIPIKNIHITKREHQLLRR